MRSKNAKKAALREKTDEELEVERLAKAQEEKEEEELEKKCEQWCGVACKIAVFVPLVFAYLFAPFYEYTTRPAMVVDTSVNLGGSHAVVTGGCSGLGLQTATLLVESGTSVILGCRDAKGATAQSALRKLKAASSKWSKSNHGRMIQPPMVWPLRLERLSSVRSFARQYIQNVGKLQILVNNAGTTQACNTTDDGVEHAFQANYLGHFLLTTLLLPTITTSSPSRIVHVICRNGYLRPAHGWSHWFREGYIQGWLGLPTPILEGVRVGATLVEAKQGANPSEDDDLSGHEIVDDGADDEPSYDDEEGSEENEDEPPNEQKPQQVGGREWSGTCKPAEAYANAKLAVLSFSHELERRLRSSPDSDGVVSHAINPNAITSEFFDKGPLPASPDRVSRLMSFLPPVWIAGKVFGFLNRHMSKAMMRSVEHGSKGVFHVATSSDLAKLGGGLFDDTESAFTDCGRPAHMCARVSRSWQPPVVYDRQAAAQLWELSEGLVREQTGL